MEELESLKNIIKLSITTRILASETKIDVSGAIFHISHAKCEMF